MDDIEFKFSRNAFLVLPGDQGKRNSHQRNHCAVNLIRNLTPLGAPIGPPSENCENGEINFCAENELE